VSAALRARHVPAAGPGCRTVAVRCRAVLLPVICPVCDRPGRAPCERCAAELRRAPSLPCPPGLASCAALLDYDGAGRELVARLKYRNARSSVPFLVEGMSALVGGRPVDVVTWAPTTRARRRRRGFDQSELLARGVARHMGRPARPLLRRPAGAPQTGRTAGERWSGVRFSVTARRLPAGARVLLVDDVVTSGATLAAGARALLVAGASEVHAVAAARARPGRTLRHGRVRVCG